MDHDDLPAELNALTRDVIGAAISVHRVLGPALPERACENALAIELRASWPVRSSSK